MPSADTDSATRTDASAGSPEQGSGALEHRIDELLKDVEESLESLDEASAPDPSPVVDAPGLDVGALSAELDGALREAERVVEAERIEQAAVAPERAPEGGVVGAESAENPGTLDALDAALADAAVAAEGAVSESDGSWGAGFGTPAKMVTAPSPSVPVVRVETAAHPIRHADPEPSPIPAMVAHAAGVQVEASRPHSATGVESESGAALPLLRSQGVLERGLRVVSSPLTLVSPSVRDLIGWVGLWVAFNAVCVWVFVAIAAPGAGDASARSGGAAGLPGAELRAE